MPDLMDISSDCLTYDYLNKPWFKPDNPPRSEFEELNFPVRDLVIFLRSWIAIEVNLSRLGVPSKWTQAELEAGYQLDSDNVLLANTLALNDNPDVDPNSVFNFYMGEVRKRLALL